LRNKDRSVFVPVFRWSSLPFMRPMQLSQINGGFAGVNR
jgi:hypothetical protein